MKKVIIIGCGYHARSNLVPAVIHSGLFSEIMIYDLSINAFNLLKDNLSNDDLKKISFLDDFSEIDKNLDENILAIISTPADSHLYYFKALVSRGVQFIYIEKPLAQSLEDIDELSSLSESSSIKVASGFYNSYIDPLINFSDYQAQYNLGPLCGVKAYGGNNDLSAFGIHIIDLANMLFDSEPIHVVANIIGTTINPRGEKYLYHGGSIILEYPATRELIISYHPVSYVSNRVQLIFKYGLINFEYCDLSTMRIFSVQDKSEGRDVYKHQPAELVDERKLTFDWNQYFSDIFVKMVNGDNYPNLKRNIVSTSALIGSLISDEMGQRLEFPVDKKNPLYKKKYPIT